MHVNGSDGPPGKCFLKTGKVIAKLKLSLFPSPRNAEALGLCC